MSSSTFVAICFDSAGLPFVHIRQLLPTGAPTDSSAAGIAINTDGLFLSSNEFSNLLIQLKGLEMMLLDITAKNNVQYSANGNNNNNTLKCAASEPETNWQAKLATLVASASPASVTNDADALPLLCTNDIGNSGNGSSSNKKKQKRVYTTNKHLQTPYTKMAVINPDKNARL